MPEMQTPDDPFRAPLWPFVVADLPGNRPLRVNITATGDDAARIAAALDALKVTKLRLDGEFEVDRKGNVTFEGTLGAPVAQPCVVTLEPVRTRIDEPLRRIFRADDTPPADHHQILADEDIDHDPLPDIIDLGVVATEALALALPPFPRAEGAELSVAQFTEPGQAPMTDDEARPFAGLAALKDKLQKDE